MIRRARVEDAFGIAETHVAAWHETYADLVPASFLARLSVEGSVGMWADRVLLAQDDPRFVVAVATDDESGAIVGFVSGHRSGDGTGFAPIASDDETVRCAAELSALYLLARAQRRGQGRALFEVVRAHFTAHAWLPFGLWVLVGNPAEAFYRHLGGVAIRDDASSEIEGVARVHRAYLFD